MTELFTPHVGLMVWTVITFALLVLVLGRFGWGPLIKALDERELRLKEQRDGAEAARVAAEKIKFELEQKWGELQDKANELLKRAEADGAKAREDILKAAEIEARRLSEQALAQLEQDRAKLSRELRAEVAGLSVKLAGKLLKHSMNVKENESLVQGFINELEKGSN